MSIRVLVADDHEVVRRGLVSLLAGSEVKIVGEASSGDEAIKLTRKLKPDVVLLDLSLPDVDGLDLDAAVLRELGEVVDQHRAGDARALWQSNS